jgi:hypothetical protein
MRPLEITLIVFVCVFAGALLGMALRKVLPEHHRSGESRDLVKSGMALIGTMSALVLGLLVASAKSSYDVKRDAVTELAARVGLLDRVLTQYGPETKDIRDLLRAVVARGIDQMWQKSRSPSSGLAREDSGGNVVYARIGELSPKNDAQRALQQQASGIASEIAEERLLMFAKRGSSISIPFLVVVVFWLAVNFVSFGLFAPPNPTAVATLFICAISVACAVFLILEMDQPFQGLIQISDAPLREALEHLGR